MANSWGELSWSTGDWGRQNDTIATPSGIGLTITEGEEDSFNNQGWGRTQWGNLAWGAAFQNATAELTGQQLNISQNNVGVSGEINSGWGRVSWGENAWGIEGDVLVTGIGLTAGVATGSVIIDVENAVTGQQLNWSIGTLSFDIGATVDLTGLALELLSETAIGDANTIASPSGIGLTITPGNLDSYNEAGWGRDDWGTEVWGAQGIWETVSVTGQGLTIDSGEKEAWGEESWGNAEWGGNYVTETDISVSPIPTGLQLNTSLGDTAETGTGNVDLTGVDLEFSIGDTTETANADVVILDSPSIALSVSDGTATGLPETIAVLTGQELEIAEGAADLVITVAVELTGNALEIVLGNEVSQVWKEVDTGTSVAYTEVSTGTTVTWNEVDTAA